MFGGGGVAQVARSFGFDHPPRVNLNLESKAKHARAAKRAGIDGAEEEGGGSEGGAAKRGRYGAGGHAFSAGNPYGKRQEGDKRQFVRI